MQVIAADAAFTRAHRLVVLRSGLVAVLLLAAGVALGWLCLGTPLVSRFMPYGRPTTIEVAAGVLAWGFAIFVPAAFLILGIAQLAATLDDADTARHAAATPRLRSSLGNDHLAVTDLPLPGGDRVPELVLGPFGIAVLGTMPPPSLLRRVGDRWEARDARGRWLPSDGPLERTAHDADRVRRWLAHADHEFTVRIYAALVTDTKLERTPACAVVARRDVAEWLMALPFQRGLTPDRRELLVERIRAIIPR